MKKPLLYLTAICLLIALFPFKAAASDTVAVSDASEFSDALDAAADGGTIMIDGSIMLPADFQWNSHNKTVTVTGGTLDFSRLSDVILGNGVIFEGITLQFAAGSSLYANGKHLTIGKSVNVSGEPTVYGGGRYTTVGSTDVTLLAGTYTDIFGGGYFGGVSGDVNLSVGGRVNTGLETLSHKHTYCVYGGCSNGKVDGKVQLTFSGLARANYVFGGALGAGSRISGGIEVQFLGGEATGLCGGSRNADHKGDVQLTMTGGTVEQVFGGCEHSALTGNIELNILGGTITRRIYGGCYNEVSGSGVWETANYVTGDIYLTIGSNARINFTTGSADRAIYAHSRQKTLSDKENTYIRFTDEEAAKKYSGKLGAQDGIMRSIMSGVSAADMILDLNGEASQSPNLYPFPWGIMLLLPAFAGILILYFLHKRKNGTQ